MIIWTFWWWRQITATIFRMTRLSSSIKSSPSTQFYFSTSVGTTWLPRIKKAPSRASSPTSSRHLAACQHPSRRGSIFTRRCPFCGPPVFCFFSRAAKFSSVPRIRSTRPPIPKAIYFDCHSWQELIWVIAPTLSIPITRVCIERQKGNEHVDSLRARVRRFSGEKKKCLFSRFVFQSWGGN